MTRPLRTDPRLPAPRFVFGDAPRSAALLGELRRLQQRDVGARDAVDDVDAACDLCGKPAGREHRHLVQTEERRIVCACESCFAMRGGDAGHRPVGTRREWLGDLALTDELWHRLGIPIGLAFFLHSASAERIVALYPSPAGATEATPPPEAWDALVALDARLATLAPDVEALVVSRLAPSPQAAILPIDACYELVGRIKVAWEGISGGPALHETVPAFFDEVRRAERER
ncbi:MAG: hypothetical protein KC560_13810 [Myxococcales bacterium]|nr:hypothetical protein [Myxococcales bacterium]